MHNILFLTLKVFSATGGIEKVCRVAGKALYEMTLTGTVSARLFCMHDTPQDAIDNKYFPSEMFRGFGNERVKFIYAALKKAKESDTIILSHINLLLVGWLIKKASPSTKVIMLAHGIEVWNTFGNARKMMLDCCDEIYCVSNYTKQKIEELHHISPEKCKVINNCLDPYLPLSASNKKDDDLLAKYGFNKSDKILFTLTRLSMKDRYKGYDKVLESIAILKIKEPGIRYLIAGSYEDSEKKYMDDSISRLGLEKNVAIAGYVPDSELANYFNLADVYVMPSMKEGFGIVFIEAMYYGVPVIAGNLDGSVDALCNGELGLLVDPNDVAAITEAIEKILNDKQRYVPSHEKLLHEFSYDTYKVRLESVFKPAMATA